MTLLWIGIILWSLIAIVGGSIFFYIRYKKAKEGLRDKISDLAEEEQINAYKKLKVEHLKQVGIVLGGLVILAPVFIFVYLIGSCFAYLGVM